jgi:valyl-tRNA synthetase
MTIQEQNKHSKMKASIGTKSVPRKSMDEAMDAKYNPVAVEKGWYDWWVSQGYFTPSAEKGANARDNKKFVICLPPPNVTGHLHIGHALTMSIEDCMTRWHRMKGDETLWLPGTDHAGIATQSVVEKLLFKKEGKTRHDLGREEFLRRVWEWKEDKGSHIQAQSTRMAASLDWSREFFTMDDKLSRAVSEAFCRFYEQGKMFRDVRLVNWSSYLRTALSDLEVDYEEITKRTLLPIPGTTDKVEVGVITVFKYPIKGRDGEFVSVATTRLETMLGDVAVAVHPEDPRYMHLIGSQLVHPFFPNRDMRIVADTYVDKEFGTGCVKITPAHDPNDFALGKRHNLEMINILADDGTINSDGAEFAGLHRFLARRKVEERLKELGLFVEKKDNPMKVPRCSRSGDIIEPVLRPQWWLDCAEFASAAKKVVEDGRMKIHPLKMHDQTWYNWLDNVKDWCVSRQLWWGHRIPAYKVVSPVVSQTGSSNALSNDGPWFVARSMEAAKEAASKSLQIPTDSIVMEQDSDVLDTWFSSGLLPMSGLGWPDLNAEDMKAFFPSSMLETGWDILFFWVARMVMMSLGLTGQVPFSNVYLHALIRDAHGRKMSKSLGNVIDPLEVIEGITLAKMKENILNGNLPESEIKKATKALEEDFPEGIEECGSDALRFALLAYTLQPRAVNLDVKRIVGYRHFCNKLWNAVKFGLSYFDPSFQPKGIHSILFSATNRLEFEDEWILSKLSSCATKVNCAMESRNFFDATNAIYSFWLYDFCDYYLELVKPRMKAGASGEVAKEVLYICIDWGLRLLHPMMPFVTEELYQRLPHHGFEAICIADYPQGVVAWNNARIEDQMETLKTVICGFRSSMAQLGMKPNAKPKGYVCTSGDDVKLLTKVSQHVVTLAKLDSLEVLADGAKPETDTCVVSVLNERTTIYVDAAGLVDFKAEVDKLLKKRGLVAKALEGLEKKMSIPGYEEKVPAEVRQANQDKLDDMKSQMTEMDSAIAMLKKAGGL